MAGPGSDPSTLGAIVNLLTNKPTRPRRPTNSHISLIDNSNALAKIKALTNFVLSGTFNTFPGTKFPGKQKVDKVVLVNGKGKFNIVSKLILTLESFLPAMG